jgi:hypothetical protein
MSALEEFDDSRQANAELDEVTKSTNPVSVFFWLQAVEEAVSLCRE